MNKKILVIGGGGYVGTVLVNKLLSIGHEVSVYDLFIYGNYLKSNNNLKIIQGDVRNIEKLKKNLKGIDTVIHLACISNDPSFELNPLLAKSINYHKNKITVFGGEQLRPNIYMEDMIRAYLCVLEAPLHLVSGQAFNVGEENLTVNEIALSVKKELKKDVIIEKSHSDDNRSYHVSSSKIKKHLNFDLKHNINDGIRSLLNAFEAKILLNTISDEKFYNLKVLAKTDLL